MHTVKRIDTRHVQHGKSPLIGIKIDTSGKWLTRTYIGPADSRRNRLSRLIFRHIIITEPCGKDFWKFQSPQEAQYPKR